MSNEYLHPDKNERLRAFLATTKCAGALLTRRANIAWIADGADVHVDAGSEFGIAALLWTPTRRLIFTDNIEAARLRAEEFPDPKEWEIVERPWWEAPPLFRATDWMGEKWAREHPILDDRSVDHFAELRFSLTPAERDRARTLGHEAAEIMQSVMMRFTRGTTEHELAGTLGGELRKRGIFTPVLLVAADDRIARFRHPIPTTQVINATVMAAICAQRQGLIVSLTRLVHFGAALPDDLQRRHDAVCHVDATLHTHTTVGTRWSDIFNTAISVYHSEGFATEWQQHHQGGPMGYAARDFKATAEEHRTVRPHQVVGWNPSITGTKSEDTVLAAEMPGAPAEVVTTMSAWPMNERAAAGMVRRPDILLRHK